MLYEQNLIKPTWTDLTVINLDKLCFHSCLVRKRKKKRGGGRQSEKKKKRKEKKKVVKSF